jgi:hypothetical protein
MRPLHAAARVVLVLAALAVISVPASATTVIREALESLHASNSTVIHGRVTSLHSYWNADHSFILTDVRVQPIEKLKGLLGGDEVTFTVMGGTVGDVTVLVIGGPELSPGSEYVMFLNEEDLLGARRMTMRSLSQGAFEVSRGPKGVRALSQARGEPLLPDATGEVEAAGGEEGFELSDMIAKLRSLSGGR